MQFACLETHATLCVYSNQYENIAETVYSLIGLRPSRVTENMRRSFAGFDVPRYGWFLTSKDIVESFDVSDHISWLLQQIGNTDAIDKLRTSGFKIKIICYWVSGGQGGGPVLGGDLIHALADHSVDVEFDIYFADGERH